MSLTYSYNQQPSYYPFWRASFPRYYVDKSLNSKDVARWNDNRIPFTRCRLTCTDWQHIFYIHLRWAKILSAIKRHLSPSNRQFRAYYQNVMSSGVFFYYCYLPAVAMYESGEREKTIWRRKARFALAAKYVLLLQVLLRVAMETRLATEKWVRRNRRAWDDLALDLHFKPSG